MYNDMTGIILCGGKSSRMGQNKAFLKLGGQTAIERTAALMGSLFAKNILITNTPAEYTFLNLEMFQDIYKDRGPLAGIHAGLAHSTTRKNFVISCDMPMVTQEAIRFIVDFPSTQAIVVPLADGFVQQLCGIYNKECAETIKRILQDYDSNEIRHKGQQERKCKVMALLDEMNAQRLDLEKIYPGHQSSTFLNMNHPEDYQAILKLL